MRWMDQSESDITLILREGMKKKEAPDVYPGLRWTFKLTTSRVRDFRLHCRAVLAALRGHIGRDAAGEHFLEVVTRLAVLAEIQPVILIARADAEADDDVHKLEENQRPDHRDHPGDERGDELAAQLGAAAFVF